MTMAANANTPSFAQSMDPSNASAGSRMNVARGQRSRYAYTPHVQSKRVERCLVTRTLRLRLATTEIKARRDA